MTLKEIVRRFDEIEKLLEETKSTCTKPGEECKRCELWDEWHKLRESIKWRT